MLLYVYHFWDKIKIKYRKRYYESRTDLNDKTPSYYRLDSLKVGKVGFYYKIHETEWTSQNFEDFIDNGVINSKKVMILSKPRKPNPMVKVMILEDHFDASKGRKMKVDGRQIITCNKKDVDSNALFTNCKFCYSIIYYFILILLITICLFN